MKGIVINSIKLLQAFIFMYQTMNCFNVIYSLKYFNDCSIEIKHGGRCQVAFEIILTSSCDMKREV